MVYQARQYVRVGVSTLIIVNWRGPFNKKFGPIGKWTAGHGGGRGTGDGGRLLLIFKAGG